MKKGRFYFAAAIACALAFFNLGQHAQAQATRTWVSGVGDDVNPASRTAPAKTFAGAISKTAPGGEIDALDPGGYGTVAITQSVTIDGATALSSILASGATGVTINTTGTDTVTLRNLSINGAYSGANGITIVGGGNINVENCTIFAFSNNGINFAPTSGAKLSVRNCIIRECAGNGILAHPSSEADVTVSNCQISNNGVGFRADDKANAVLSNCVVTSNNNLGVSSVNTSAAPVRVSLESCTLSANGGTAVKTQGANAHTFVGDCSISGNGAAVNPTNGTIRSYGNNRVNNNTNPSAFSSTAPEM
jgi:parallel beta-helix repeat protein